MLLLDGATEVRVEELTIVHCPPLPTVIDTESPGVTDILFLYASAPPPPPLVALKVESMPPLPPAPTNTAEILYTLDGTVHVYVPGTSYNTLPRGTILTDIIYYYKN
jgi:hypothetical protein